MQTVTQTQAPSSFYDDALVILYVKFYIFTFSLFANYSNIHFLHLDGIILHFFPIPSK